MNNLKGWWILAKLSAYVTAILITFPLTLMAAFCGYGNIIIANIIGTVELYLEELCSSGNLSKEDKEELVAEIISNITK